MSRRVISTDSKVHKSMSKWLYLKVFDFLSALLRISTSISISSRFFDYKFLKHGKGQKFYTWNLQVRGFFWKVLMQYFLDTSLEHFDDYQYFCQCLLKLLMWRLKSNNLAIAWASNETFISINSENIGICFANEFSRPIYGSHFLGMLWKEIRQRVCSSNPVVWKHRQ